MSVQIDLTRLAIPKVLTPIGPEQLLDQFKARFVQSWDELRAKDPTLPIYDVGALESDPAIIAGEVFSYCRLLDRNAVQVAIRSLLAVFATGDSLDAIAAGRGLERLTIRAAGSSRAALLERDDQLLQRYLLSFGRAAAGSVDGYRFAAFTACPNLLDVQVNGFEQHHRLGDVDIVLLGEGGNDVSELDRVSVRDAVFASNVKPSATGVAVMLAIRNSYSAQFRIEVPAGPDPQLVADEVKSRVRNAAEARMRIGGEIPDGYLKSAAFGDSVISVEDLAPVTIASNPYAAPVLETIGVEIEVR